MPVCQAPARAPSEPRSAQDKQNSRGLTSGTEPCMKVCSKLHDWLTLLGHRTYPSEHHNGGRYAATASSRQLAPPRLPPQLRQTPRALLLSLKHYLLHLHLVKNVVSLYSVAQRHDLVRHEPQFVLMSF